MKQIHKSQRNSPITELRNSFQDLFSAYSHKYSEVLEAISRKAVPFGGNLLEGDHLKGTILSNGSDEPGKPDIGDHETSENRYSVLYTRDGHYHHAGCSSQAEAQTVLGLMMTDENRIPVGIYDSKTDLFEWEVIGQYFHSQESISEQQSRLDEILTMARTLRRRDSSWEPGYLQRPGFFA